MVDNQWEVVVGHRFNVSMQSFLFYLLCITGAGTSIVKGVSHLCTDCFENKASMCNAFQVAVKIGSIFAQHLLYTQDN